MDIPITQSKAWQKLQEDLGETSFFEQTENYQYLVILKKTPVGNYLYLPYGPVVKSETSLKESLKSLKNLAAKHRAIFIRIEPQNPNLISNPPKNIIKTKDLNPKDTWVLDLSQSEAEIIKNFSQGTRTRYNTYAKKGLSVKTTKNPDDIRYLVNLQQKLAKNKHIHAYPEAYLKKELEQPFATLYLVKYRTPNDSEPSPNSPPEDSVLAASLFFDHQNTRYYMQSAADGEYKKLPATVALLTKAIFDAKEKGIKYFDFWGIAPDGASDDHPWKGFTEFKKSFGGYPVHYAGTYDVVLSPSKYKLYQLSRRANRVLRKTRR
ncbi:peptidoglycan bridge formation glycyltransferase FemA/FemB family protein [Candidatus Saccharibacteria bacterium]|nr:peptidoglycan bridge formation glycyltransferase FemA/FemB family protein [Candidatus Saccharibacteria bacterium]